MRILQSEIVDVGPLIRIIKTYNSNMKRMMIRAASLFALPLSSAAVSLAKDLR